ERMEARGSFGEAAWALEQAATATEDERLREETWRQLATFAQERLRDSAQAERLTARADAMKELRLAAEEAMAAAQAEQQAAAEAAEAEGLAPVPEPEPVPPQAPSPARTSEATARVRVPTSPEGPTIL